MKCRKIKGVCYVLSFSLYQGPSQTSPLMGGFSGLFLILHPILHLIRTKQLLYCPQWLHTEYSTSEEGIFFAWKCPLLIALVRELCLPWYLAQPLHCAWHVFLEYSKIFFIFLPTTCELHRKIYIIYSFLYKESSHVM